jgi:hypothetical protein
VRTYEAPPAPRFSARQLAVIIVLAVGGCLVLLEGLNAVGQTLRPVAVASPPPPTCVLNFNQELTTSVVSVDVSGPRAQAVCDLYAGTPGAAEMNASMGGGWEGDQVAAGHFQDGTTVICRATSGSNAAALAHEECGSIREPTPVS